jgi:NitT/TauT family transport system ATP-binding protein
VSSFSASDVRGGPAAGAGAILDIESVSKTYGTGGSTVHALQQTDLTVRSGEFVTLVGPSGCGKSTLLNIVAGLLASSEGRVRFKGEPMDGPSRDIGFMFQAPVLLPWRTVERNVLLPAEVFGQDVKAQRTRAREVLGLVGLGEFADRYPRQLSGGMQQRVSLARVLAYEPDVLLMDEPFGALDEFTRETMNLELLKIAGATGVTVLFVTHNIGEAVFLADRVVVMSPRPGRVAGIVEVGLPRPRTIEQQHEPIFADLVFEVRGLLGGHR